MFGSEKIPIDGEARMIKDSPHYIITTSLEIYENSLLRFGVSS